MPGDVRAQLAALSYYDDRVADREHGLIRAAAAVMDVPGRRHEAELPIKLLGRMRAERAVPFLVERLTYRGQTERRAGGLLSPGEIYPCAAALMQVGGPAVNPVVAAAETTDDALFHRLAGVVVVRALGADLAAEYLARRAAKLPAGDARRRVDAVRRELPTAVMLAEVRGAGRGESWRFQDMPKP